MTHVVSTDHTHCCTHSGKERWRHHSQYMTKEADAQRVRNLAASQWDCSRFGAFVSLADAMLLSQMMELARLAVSVALHQVECGSVCIVCVFVFGGVRALPVERYFLHHFPFACKGILHQAE